MLPAKQTRSAERQASEQGSGRPAEGIRALRLSRRSLDQTYVGRRDSGVPTVLVVRATGGEVVLAAPGGVFSWGWPSTAGARRLAHALLLDLTGREAPLWVLDRLAARELAHLSHAAFSLTGRQILGWVDGHDSDSMSDWPPARRPSTAVPILGAPRDALAPVVKTGAPRIAPRVPSTLGSTAGQPRPLVRRDRQREPEPAPLG